MLSGSGSAGVESLIAMFLGKTVAKDTPVPEELFELEKMRDVLLSTAKKHFAEAAILHYELEDIYRNSIDFSKNDAILNRIISYIL